MTASAPRIVIGRDGGDIIIKDPQSSAMHAELEFKNGQLVVRDLGSKNGTFAGSIRLREGVVPRGAQSTIGGTMLVIATGALTFAFTDEIRFQVRTMWAVSMAGYRHDDVDRGYALLRALARTLDRSDMDLEEGRISPAEHEARWWLVYDAMDNGSEAVVTHPRVASDV